MQCEPTTEKNNSAESMDQLYNLKQMEDEQKIEAKVQENNVKYITSADCFKMGRSDYIPR